MPSLNQIREKEAPESLGMQITCSILTLLFGMTLGFLSKYLDCTPSNELPGFLEYLDVRNFLGRFAVWVLIGLWLSVSSRSPGRAAIHVFLFFFGMVASYYLYTQHVAGFFPGNYTFLWFGFALISPILAMICWYAGGKGAVAFLLSMILLGALFWCSFLCGRYYVEPRSALELIIFLCGIAVLRRDTLKASGIMTVLGVGLGIVLFLVVPFRFG